MQRFCDIFNFILQRNTLGYLTH